MTRGAQPSDEHERAVDPATAGEEALSGSFSAASPPGLASTAAWSYVMQGSQQAGALVVGLVLAALLGPEVFGLSAMALVYIGVLNLVQRQGLSLAVIQRHGLTDAHMNAAFWLQIGASLIISLLSVGLAGLWAEATDEPLLRYVIVALTPLLPLSALSAIQEATLVRQERMRALALRSALSVVIGGVVGVAAAMAGAGVWALVAQQLVTSAVALATLWWASDWRPSLSFSRAAAQDLLGFSAGGFVGALGSFLASRGDALVLGLFVGPTTLGIYRLAERLVDSAATLTTQPVVVIGLPRMSRYQAELEALREVYRKLTKLSGLVALPILGILAGSADPLTRLLGPEWLPAAGALQWLAVAGALRALTAANAPLLLAVGRPHLGAAVLWAVALTSLGGLAAVAATIGDTAGEDTATVLAAVKAAIAVTAALLVQPIFLRTTGMSVGAAIRMWTPAIVVGLVSAAATWAASALVLTSGGSAWLAIAAGGAAGVAASAAVFMIDSETRGLVNRGRRALSGVRLHGLTRPPE